MQYSVHGSDGNQYGPVDLITLKQWVQEGRVLPDTRVTDNLSNSTLLASQMSELGMTSMSQPYANASAPPQPGMSPYSNPQFGAQAKQPTRLWGILGWLAFGIVVSMFTRYGGIFVSGWNVFDAFKAKSEDDPKAGLCLGFAIGGFALILLWTYLKSQTVK